MSIIWYRQTGGGRSVGKDQTVHAEVPVVDLLAEVPAVGEVLLDGALADAEMRGDAGIRAALSN